MNAVLDMLDEAQAVGGPAGEAVRPYSTRSWSELSRMVLDPPPIVWGGYALGAVGALFGQGGLGKSRMALNIVRNQVLGLPFAGMLTASGPLRHLMMGSENSIHRLIDDIRHMTRDLSPEQVERLGGNVRLATLEQPDDTSISLASPDNLDRWRMTLRDWPPDMLWVDPWGDVLDGDANSDDDARGTIAALRRVLRMANPGAGLVILAHARTGARNIAQAVGYDAANFGKGSKALHAAARCVWNLAPGDESDNPPVVCVHAKSNDCPKQRTVALRLDPDTRLYSPIEGFDLETWLADVGQRANGRCAAKRRPGMTLDAAFAALGDSADTKTAVERLLRDKGATRDDAKDQVAKLLDSGRWTEWRDARKNAPTYVGPPAAIERRRAEAQARKTQGAAG